jgi:hypothetical protein
MNHKPFEKGLSEKSLFSDAYGSLTRFMMG